MLVILISIVACMASWKQRYLHQLHDPVILIIDCVTVPINNAWCSSLMIKMHGVKLSYSCCMTHVLLDHNA